MTIHYLDQLDITNKRVLIRVDYNVPYDSEQNITDDTRITATIPTINYCREHDARIILVSHLGRPKGKADPKFSLQPVARHLQSVLNQEVQFSDTPLGDDQLIQDVENLQSGQVMLLENIRFYEGETKNDENLGKQLGNLADVYVNDAFATAHRAHSSNDAVTRYVDHVCAGFLLKQEIEYFKKSMEAPERPFTAVIGGAKVSTKLDALNNIIQKVDNLVIGGGMAFTFLKAQGKEIGKSLLEDDLVDTASGILAHAEQKGVSVLLPTDIVITSEFSNETNFSTVPVDMIPPDMMGLDIGPESIKNFNSTIFSSKTVIWNGPMGAFEMSNYAEGTLAVGKAIADTDCVSIVGGGDSVTAVNKLGLADKMSYISTGGGAFLELLEGKNLPALTALDR